MKSTTFANDSNNSNKNSANISNEIQLMKQVSQSSRESQNINNHLSLSSSNNGNSQQLWFKQPSKNNNNNTINPLGNSRILSHICESETEFNNNDIQIYKNSESNNFNNFNLNINDQQLYSHYDESSSSYLGNNDMMFMSGSPSKSRRYQQQQQYQQQQSQSQIRMNMFYAQNEEMFQNMRNELDLLMGKFDDKVIEALGKREYELLKSFRVTMDRMTDDLANTHKKLANFHKEAETDIKVVCLERQLKFFRENCEELSKSNLELKAQTAELKNSMEVLSAEAKIAKQAHVKAQQRLTELLEIQAMKQPVNNSPAENKIQVEKESKISRQFKYRDSLITALKVIELQENPHQAAFVIEQLVIDKLGGRDTLIEDLKIEIQQKKRQIKQLHSELRAGNNNNNNTQDIKWNPIREIFLQGMRQIQSGKSQSQQQQLNINKNDGSTINDSDTEERMQIVQRMFASNSFLEAVNAMLFQQKCCNYPDCKFNILPGGGNEENDNNSQAKLIDDNDNYSKDHDDYDETHNNFLTSIATSTNGYNNKTRNATTATATKTSTNQNSLQATGWLYNKRWSQVDAKAWGKIPTIQNGQNIINKQVSLEDEGKEIKQPRESLHGKKLFSSNIREIISSGGQRVRSYSLSHGNGTDGDINRNNKNINKRINVTNNNSLLNSSLNKSECQQEKNPLSYYQDNNTISKHISNVINEFQLRHPGRRESQQIGLQSMQDKNNHTNNKYQQKVDKVVFKNNKIF